MAQFHWPEGLGHAEMDGRDGLAAEHFNRLMRREGFIVDTQVQGEALLALIQAHLAVQALDDALALVRVPGLEAARDEADTARLLLAAGAVCLDAISIQALAREFHITMSEEEARTLWKEVARRG
jgi:hypothetical protein